MPDFDRTAALSLFMIGEILFQDGDGLFPENAGGDGDIRTAVFKHGAAAFGAPDAQNVTKIDIACGINQSAKLCPDHGPAAHIAGFAAGIERVGG